MQGIETIHDGGTTTRPIESNKEISRVDVNFRDIMDKAKEDHGFIYEEDLSDPSDVSDESDDENGCKLRPQENSDLAQFEKLDGGHLTIALENKRANEQSIGDSESELTDLEELEKEYKKRAKLNESVEMRPASTLLVSSGADQHKLSRKERKELRHKDRWDKKTEESKQRSRKRKMQRIKDNPGEHDFGRSLLSRVTVTKVQTDVSNTTRTIPAFIGKPVDKRRDNFHKSCHTSTPTLPAGSTVNKELLHPDCDQDVMKKVLEDRWNYIPNDKSIMQVVVDKFNRIIALKAMPPVDEWPKISMEVQEEFSELRRKFKPKFNMKKNKLSRMEEPQLCPTLKTGVSFGGGQTKPQKFSHKSYSEAKCVEDILQNDTFRKVVNHITSCFWTCFPGAARTYLSLQERIGITNVEEQRRHGIFDRSPFCATTINIGPKTQTTPHKDSKNLIGGLCAIAVFGNFDHRTSGHILLHEIKTVMEIRNGDVLFIPSAGITHSNSSLKSHEERSSLVQYTAGGLFRWLWNQVQSKESQSEMGMKRWEETLGLIGKSSALKNSLDERNHRIQTVQERIEQGNSYLIPNNPRL